MKKILILALCLALLVPQAAFAQTEPSEWAKNEVDALAADFLTASGFEIDYAAPITREQFAVVALYLYGSVSKGGIPQMTVENPFTDCNNPLVAAAYGLGLVMGTSDTTFEPDSPITREQICTMIARMAEKEGMDIPYFDFESLDIEGYADSDEVSDWAKYGVKLCIALGLIKGTDEGKILPRDNCTVEQALIIAKRIRNLV